MRGGGHEGASGRGQLAHLRFELRGNLKSISHRQHPILVAFVWELTPKTINLPLGCPQVASRVAAVSPAASALRGVFALDWGMQIMDGIAGGNVCT